MKAVGPSAILKAIHETAKNIDAGDSIQIARKKAVGSLGSTLDKKVIEHPLYLFLLNSYMRQVRPGVSYFFKDGKLTRNKPVKRKKLSTIKK